MQSLFQIIDLLLSVAIAIVLIHVIMSWLINFGILNRHQVFVAQVWYSLGRLLNPLYDRIRRFLPEAGGIDFAPLVVLIAIYIIRIVLRNNMFM